MIKSAITTRYHGPTNHRGARITASANGFRVTIPYDYSGTDAAHIATARALADKLGWDGELVSGHLANGDVVHLIAPVSAARRILQADAVRRTVAQVELAKLYNASGSVGG